MAIRMRYEIYEAGKGAPMLTTYDRQLAKVEFGDLLRKGGCTMYRLNQEPEVSEPTKSEEYLLLVWTVRKLVRRYFANGRKHEDMIASQEQETKLDKWNLRTWQFMQSHPGYQPADTKSYALYQLVSEWRSTWKESKKYKQQKDFDQRVLNEMNKKRGDLERAIDNCVRDRLGLI